MSDGRLLGTADIQQICSSNYSGLSALTLGNGVLYASGHRCGVIAIDTGTMAPLGLATARPTDLPAVVVNGMLYVTWIDDVVALASR